MEFPSLGSLSHINMYKKTLLIALLAPGLTHTQAQQATSEPVVFSLYADVGIPSKEFKKAVDNPVGGTAVGVGTNLLFNLKGKKQPSPLALGVDFSYLTFGRDKIDATTSSPPYKTTFNYYSMSGVMRVILTNRTTGFTPFIDGMLGVKIFNTRTKIDKNAIDVILNTDQPEVINTTNDYGLGYGLGAGWYVRKAVGENGQKAPSFTMRAMFLWGDPTRYVKRSSMQVSNGFVQYESGYTNTNMILIQLGIALD